MHDAARTRSRGRRWSTTGPAIWMTPRPPSLDEHLFGCADCTAASARVAAVAEALRAAIPSVVLAVGGRTDARARRADPRERFRTRRPPRGRVRRRCGAVDPPPGRPGPDGRRAGRPPDHRRIDGRARGRHRGRPVRSRRGRGVRRLPAPLRRAARTTRSCRCPSIRPARPPARRREPRRTRSFTDFSEPARRVPTVACPRGRVGGKLDGRCRSNERSAPPADP